MRGHGFVSCAGSAPLTVAQSIYMQVNARVQAEAERLGGVTYLSEEEGVAAVEANASQVMRAWGVWARQAAMSANGRH